jgi:WS/DGAT/MGAT family acyltransferase
MKMHHSLADGGAVVKILSDSMSKDPDAPRSPPPWARAEVAPKPQSSARSAQMQRLEPADETKRYTSLLSALMKTARVAWKKSESGLVTFTSAPRSILNNRITPARRYATESVALERMQAVGNAAGGTVNDVMLAMCASALRLYLLEQNALPKRALIAHVPVGLGREDDDALGNQVASIAVSLATTIADPVKRFDAICESAKSGKALLLGMRKKTIDIYRALVIVPLMLSQLPRKSDARRTTQRRPLGGNLIISNVPGPRSTLYFRGAEVEALYPCSVLAGSCGLNITARGYCDRINFGVIGCPDSLPSLQHIAVYLGDALVELETAYGIAAADAVQPMPGRQA